jgi:hypothetical protein
VSLRVDSFEFDGVWGAQTIYRVMRGEVAVKEYSGPFAWLRAHLYALLHS